MNQNSEFLLVSLSVPIKREIAGLVYTIINFPKPAPLKSIINNNKSFSLPIQQIASPPSSPLILSSPSSPSSSSSISSLPSPSNGVSPTSSVSKSKKKVSQHNVPRDAAFSWGPCNVPEKMLEHMKLPAETTTDLKTYFANTPQLSPIDFLDEFRNQFRNDFFKQKQQLQQGEHRKSEQEMEIELAQKQIAVEFNIFFDCLQLSIQDGKYDARARFQLRKLAFILGIADDLFLATEDALALQLLLISQQTQSANKIKKNNHIQDGVQIDEIRKKSASKGRWWKIGLGAAIGGGILLVTGGIVAPFLLPVVGGIIATAAGAASAAGLGIVASTITTGGTLLMFGGAPMIAGLFGAAGASLTSYRVSNRTGGLEDFAFFALPKKISINEIISNQQQQQQHGEGDENDEEEQLSPISPSNENNNENENNNSNSNNDNSGLHVFICISGFVKDEVDTVAVWSNSIAQTYPYGEKYALRWEAKIQTALALAVENFLVRNFSVGAFRLMLAHTSVALSVAVSTIAWPLGLLAVSSAVDNPWHMAMDRAEKSGKALAHVLLKGAHGHRPVSLLGYSHGARVIFFCLLELGKHGAKGVIENVYLMGAPLSPDPDAWVVARSVVSNRFVNCYCTTDWILAFLYRALHVAFNIAGLEPINVCSANGDRLDIENIDVTEIVQGHLGYDKKLTEILQTIQLKKTRIYSQQEENKLLSSHVRKMSLDQDKTQDQAATLKQRLDQTKDFELEEQPNQQLQQNQQQQNQEQDEENEEEFLSMGVEI